MFLCQTTLYDKLSTNDLPHTQALFRWGKGEPGVHTDCACIKISGIFSIKLSNHYQ